VLISSSKRMGILGGMFDPVHVGHLQVAMQVKEHCLLDEVRLVPCGQPVHRGLTMASASQRIAMLEFAIRNHGWMKIDSRECSTNQLSYTWNTLKAIHKENPETTLYLMVGMDAFLSLPSWYRWQKIFTLSHVVVVTRPGYGLVEADLDQELRREFINRRVINAAECTNFNAGSILSLELTTLPISSTRIRTMLRKGETTELFLQQDVASFIHTHKLYQ